MTSSRSFACVFAFGTALCLVNCSFQDFDYLKNEFPAHGGTSGAASSSAGNESGGTPSTAGSSAIAGTTSASGSGNAHAGSGGTGAVSDTDAGDDAGSAGEGGQPPAVLMNGGFELGDNGVMAVPFWTNVGTTAAATVVFGQEPRSGSGRLGHWLSTGAYTVTTSQIVSPIPNGNYTFSMWVAHSLFLNSEYIFAKGYSHAQPAAEMKTDTSTAGDTTYTQIVIQHIPVTNGKIEVGIYTDGPASSDQNWSRIDDAELMLEAPGDE